MRREIWTVIASLLLSLAVVAQSNFCEELLIPTLEQVSSICEGLGRNEICYGNNLVEATFIDDSSISFSNPADIAPVSNLQSLHTAPLDSASGIFGVALMQIQSSNIPNTLPGQAVTFLLVGDVTLENAVAPDEAFVPADPIESHTTTASNIRLAPDSNSSIVWSVARDTTLFLDAQDESGNWFRLIRDEQIGWISRTIIAEVAGMAELPILRRSSRTAMQAFYFRTGIGVADCEQAPSHLIIQGPQGLETDLTINGAEVRIGSTIALSNPSQDRLRLSVLDGYAVVGQTIVPGGFSVDAIVTENHIQSTNGWIEFKPISEQELGFYQETAQSIGQDVFEYVPDVPSLEEIEIMEEAFVPPTPTPVPSPTPNNSNSSNSGGGRGTSCLDSTDPVQGDISYTLPEREGNGSKWTSTDGTCSGTVAFVLNIIRTTDPTRAAQRCANIVASGNPAFIDLSTEGFPDGYSHCWG